MDIRITHTLTLSDEAKDFLSELLDLKLRHPVGTLGQHIADVTATALIKGAVTEVVAPPEERKKVVPPGISCTRIGQDTAAEIMKLLPADIETIEKAIKRKRFDAEALLKLLWERNKLGYDGEVYHELS